MANYEINADLNRLNIVEDIFSGVRNNTVLPLKNDYSNDLLFRVQSFGTQGVDVSKALEYTRKISTGIHEFDNKLFRGLNYLDQVKTYVGDMERSANRRIEISADAAKALLNGQKYTSTGMATGNLTTITLGNTGAFAGASSLLKGLSSVKAVGDNVKTPLAGFTAYSAKLSKDALNSSKVQKTKVPTAGFTSYSAKLAKDSLKADLEDKTKSNVTTTGTKSVQPNKSYTATNSDTTDKGTTTAVVTNNTNNNETQAVETPNTNVINNAQKPINETVTNPNPSTTDAGQNVNPNPIPSPSNDSGIRIIEETTVNEPVNNTPVDSTPVNNTPVNSAPVNNTPNNVNNTGTVSYTNRGASTGNVSYTPQSEASLPKDTPITDANVTGGTTDLFDATEYEDLSNASSNVGTSRSTGGSPVIPIAVGLGAAAAVGVGAKVYKDRKENNELDLNEDRLTNDNKYWTMEDSNVIHSEKEDYAETSNYDNTVSDTLIEEEPQDVKYTAQANNIQIEDDDDINKDSWSMPDTPVETTTDLFDN